MKTVSKIICAQQKTRAVRYFQSSNRRATNEEVKSKGQADKQASVKKQERILSESAIRSSTS